MHADEQYDYLLVYFVNSGEPIAGFLAHPLIERTLADDVIVGEQSRPGLNQQSQQHGQYRPAAERIMTQAAR